MTTTLARLYAIAAELDDEPIAIALVSRRLLAELDGDWSQPVRLRFAPARYVTGGGGEAPANVIEVYFEPELRADPDYAHA